MPNTLKRKPEVQFGELTPAGIHVLAVLYAVAQSTKYPVVITSARDGKHMVNSRHPKGEAFDVRSKHIPLAEKEEVRATLERLLGPQFRVLLEHVGKANEHFHIQVRKGTTYRPAAIAAATEVVA